MAISHVFELPDFCTLLETSWMQGKWAVWPPGSVLFIARGHIRLIKMLKNMRKLVPNKTTTHTIYGCVMAKRMNTEITIFDCLKLA
jgi:hypothetical protein